jgi:hypothetical protein
MTHRTGPASLSSSGHPCSEGRTRQTGECVSAKGVTVGWCASRLLTLVLLFAYEGPRGALGDVGYFSDSLHALSSGTLAGTLTEYPLPAVGVVALPYLGALLLGSAQYYGLLLVGSALLTDAAFTGLLHRGSRNATARPVLLWLAAVPALGGLTFARFDLLTGVLVAVAVLLVARHPRLSAVAVSVATGIKLWPVLLIPAAVAAARRRLASWLVVVAVGALLAGGTVLLAGWSRLLSPLTYQTDRGLQIESVAASPAMAAWAWRPGSWTISFSPFRAYEVNGPGVGALLQLTNLFGVLLLLGLLLVWWRAFRTRQALGPQALVWVSLAATLGFIVGGKVLSPQYLLWVLPLAAAGLALGGPGARVLWRWSVVLLVATALTHLVYPVLYLSLVQHSAWTGPAVLVLVVRNGLLLVLAGSAWWQSWASVSRGTGADAGSGHRPERAARPVGHPAGCEAQTETETTRALPVPGRALVVCLRQCQPLRSSSPSVARRPSNW